MMKVEARWGKKSFSTILEHKVTVVVGDSGTGKTTIANALKSHNTLVTTTDDAEIVVLTEEIFRRELKHLKRYVKLKHPDLDLNSESLDRKYYEEIWGDTDFAPYTNSIIVVDDESFVRTHEFAIMLNCDKTNHYLFFLRDHLSNINYNIDAVKVLSEENGNYFLEQAFKPEYTRGYSDKDLVIVEGEGSDFEYFNHLISSVSIVSASGRMKIADILSKYYDSKVLVICDKCAFGSNYLDVEQQAEVNNLQISLLDAYESFEYFMLKTVFKNVTIKQLDYLQYPSEEIMYTKMLTEVTKGMPYRYSKSSNAFKTCYVEECCSNSLNKGYCKLFARKSSIVRKVDYVLSGSVFEFLLNNTIINTDNAIVQLAVFGCD